MRREILVSVDQSETRAAVIEDGDVVEIYVERPATQRIFGNIYKGIVENVLPGMEAAFVNIGLEKNAFLYAGDTGGLWRDKLGDDGARPRVRNIREVLRPGQEVMVQVVKEAIGTKGARLTTNITLPGRRLVLMPTTDYTGVSRRIEDERERTRLRNFLETIKIPGMGLIVRTVADGCRNEELVQDVEFLSRLWSRINERQREQAAPSLLHKDFGLVFRIVRDMLNEEVTGLLIDYRYEYDRIMDILGIMSPESKSKVRLYQDRGKPLFEAYGVEAEIDKALRRKVWLKCGGHVIIDQTEALVCVDVNTGKFTGATSLADTVLRTNLEAAAEIARQLRLRDLAGIIVVDFIDMERSEHRQQVIDALESAVQRDRTKVHVLGLTQLGLVEMTRKKVQQGLEAVLSRPCPYCEGRGRVLSEETMAARARRQIKESFRQAEGEAVLLEMHPSAAALLIGPGGGNLKELERETGKTIFVRGMESCHLEKMEMVMVGSRSEVAAVALPVKEGQILELDVLEPHVTNRDNGIARIEGYIIDIEKGARVVGKKVKVEIIRVFRTYARGKMMEAESETEAVAK